MENSTENKANSEEKGSNMFLKSKFREQLEKVWDLVKFAAIALAIVIPIRLYIAQPFVVSGDSMFPTFHDGQYLIVDEISYILQGPHRGDVIVFRYPKDPSRFFIKRIIGMPGEKINIKDDTQNITVTVTNDANPDGFKLTEPYMNERFTTTDQCRIHKNEITPTDKTFTTGPNEYFVMGDNRDCSSDSRIWGLLPRKLMVGRAYLRLLPFGDISYLPGAYKESK
ncbi:MAG: signal peptidase I [bacterium]